MPGKKKFNKSYVLAEPTAGVVSSSSRIAAPADSTSDPTTSNAQWISTTLPNSRINGGGVIVSSSNINGNGLVELEAASHTTSLTSSSSSNSSAQSSPQGPIYVPSGSLSPGEAAADGGQLIGSQKRKARKQTITRHDPVHAPLRRGEFDEWCERIPFFFSLLPSTSPCISFSPTVP